MDNSIWKAILWIMVKIMCPNGKSKCKKVWLRLQSLSSAQTTRKAQGRFSAYGGKLRSLELSESDFLLIVFVSKVKVVVTK